MIRDDPLDLSAETLPHLEAGLAPAAAPARVVSVEEAVVAVAEDSRRLHFPTRTSETVKVATHERQAGLETTEEENENSIEKADRRKRELLLNVFLYTRPAPP